MPFLEHMAERATYDKHRVSLKEITEVLIGQPEYFLNEVERRAPLIMVGPTLENRILVVPIEPVGREGVWRVVTAFEANTHHKTRYVEETNDYGR